MKREAIGIGQKDGRPSVLHPAGSASASVRAELPDFLACPLLRFADPDRGVCLVHPVKPLICRKFVCSRSG